MGRATFLPAGLFAALGVIAAGPGMPASARGLTSGAQTGAVVTAFSSAGPAWQHILAPADLKVTVNGSTAEVLGVQPLTEQPMQLQIVLDDAASSSTTTVHFGELRAFLATLPATTEVAVGYMRNGMVLETQAFTLDHQAAANSLRVPLGIPGLNGSPYFALSDLVEHWPSNRPAARKAVLMLTDGVDPYYGDAVLDDPYVDSAVRNSVEHGIAVYPIYLRGAGMHGDGLRHTWVTDFAQSRLDQVAERTGGHAYFQDFSSPVTISPFLKDLANRFANQYRVTIATAGFKGLQPAKFASNLPGLKLEGPARIYIK